MKINKKNNHHVGDKMHQMTTNENRLYLKRKKKKDPVNSIHGTVMESQTLLVITQIKSFLQMTSFKM